MAIPLRLAKLKARHIELLNFDDVVGREPRTKRGAQFLNQSFRAGRRASCHTWLPEDVGPRPARTQVVVDGQPAHAPRHAMALRNEARRDNGAAKVLKVSMRTYPDSAGGSGRDHFRTTCGR